MQRQVRTFPVLNSIAIGTTFFLSVAVWEGAHHWHDTLSSAARHMPRAHGHTNTWRCCTQLTRMWCEIGCARWVSVTSSTS